MASRSTALMQSTAPAFQIIVLGASGGPREDTVTGLLVRSTATNWSRGSVVAVDAGTLLAGVSRVFESSECGRFDPNRMLEITGGPFAGLKLPHKTPQANAAYVFREFISSILITHPHLDHIAGLAMNTPAVEAQSGPKTVTALPSAIAALKNHVFNNIIWPNLSDEDGGAGLVTYQRLVDGGNLRLGSGDDRGYVRVCEGLIAKCLSISHGACNQRYNPDTGRHHRTESGVFAPEQLAVTPRRASGEGLEARSAQTQSANSAPPSSTTLATVESSAFFLRDQHTGAEIIIFGDIEPDSLSLEPRNRKVWEAAAPKISAGIIRAIFIECSYTDAVDDGSLYGHLCPRHLIAELMVLSSLLETKRPPPIIQPSRPPQPARETRKRKRGLANREPIEQVSPKTRSGFLPSSRMAKKEGTEPGGSDSSEEENHGIRPLSGLQVFIIHVKDTMSDSVGQRVQILQELRTRGEEVGLGCDFWAPECGQWVLV